MIWEKKKRTEKISLNGKVLMMTLKDKQTFSRGDGNEMPVIEAWGQEK
jgi:hypothetical protein